MKKVLSILLAVVMMFVTASVPSYAANTADLVISGTEVTAKVGDTVEVPLVIEENSGFAGLNLYFTYPDELTFVSLTNAVTALTCTSDLTTVWDGAADYTGTGNLAILKFTVSENAEYAEYPVEVHFIEAFDLLGNDVTVSVSNATIKVGCTFSDADGNHVDTDNKWESDGGDHFHTCKCGTIFDCAKHSGGSATCKEKAKCEICGQEYGTLKTHIYTAKNIKSEALATAGNCRDEAVYYYSCATCGLVEGDENHTFKGAKVSTDHIGDTTTVNRTEANHATQTDGYTGDTKCLGCNQIIVYGQTIPADAHSPASDWSTDGTYHWKECAVSGCGIIINSTKNAHYSNKTDNKANCQKAAVCDECGVTYGTVGGHNWAVAYSKDARGHWYACETAGCSEKNGFAAHTPDHQGSATEEYAIKCMACQYEMEAQLGHTHVYDKEVVKDSYIASKASCDKAATYYKSCKCGAAHDTDTFSYGESNGHDWDEATCTVPKTCSVCKTTEGTALGHIEDTKWKNNSSEHWHICIRTGCGAVVESSKVAHTPDHQGSATEEYAIRCTTCQYEIETQLAHTHVYDQEVVENVYKASNATCDKAATYYKSCKCGAFHGNDTFSYGIPNEHDWDEATCTVPKTCSVCKTTEHTALGHIEDTEWKNNSSEHWHICTRTGCGAVVESSKAAHTPDREESTETDDVKCTECGYVIATYEPQHEHVHDKGWQYNNYEHWKECDCGDRASIAFHDDANQDGKCDTCGYGVPIPEDVTAPTAPKTGDNSMAWIWLALAAISGLGFITMSLSRKKK